MQSGVVACCVLVSWLAGSQVAHSVEEELAPQLAEEPAVAAVAALPSATEAELAPEQHPSLFSLLTLGAAVIGAAATPAGPCRSDVCLAASIIDRAAQLEAVRKASRDPVYSDADRLTSN